MKIEIVKGLRIVELNNIYLYFGETFGNILLNKLTYGYEKFIVKQDGIKVFIKYEKLCVAYFEITGQVLGE